MSHHSTVLDPQVDITDLYVFRKPDETSKTIFILNVNPFAPTQAQSFSAEASYELKIDTNGDACADIAFHILFSPAAGDQQSASVYRASGEAAQQTGAVGDLIIRDAAAALDGQVVVTTAGDYRFYAGQRSDPWFADVDGVFNQFQFTGHDTFAEKNIFGIALEVPNQIFGQRTQLGIWARTVAPVHGELHQVDQAGRPLITAGFNPTPEEQHEFVSTPPTEQRERFLSKFAAILQNAGYDETEAAKTAETLLPDILPYNFSRETSYPNGRLLTDDLLDTMLALITHGKATSDGVGPHTDLLDSFPYLGNPYPV